MSLSYSNSFSDLLRSEDSDEVVSAGESPEFSSDFDSSSSFEVESIARFIVDERSSFPDCGSHSLSSPSSEEDSSLRSHSVAWILKVRSFYGFQAVTGYLAVNYLDRFLNSHHLPQTSGWPLQLLSVACLSLAAKMEEPLVPSLLELQVEGAKFLFKPKTVQKMELLVLSALDWRLRLVTPFAFISFFACKLDATGTCTRLLIARSTAIILSNIREVSFLDYWPSSIAAAAVLCAASEIPSLSFVTPEHALSWCDGLSKDKVSSCYELMRQSMMDRSRRKSVKVIPQFRVTAQINRTRSHCESSSSSSSTSSPSPPYYNKRRKLNNHSWIDDGNYGSSG